MVVLYELKPVEAALLMYLHTDVISIEDTRIILKWIEYGFYKDVNQKGMHETTRYKISCMSDLSLQYFKLRLINQQPSKGHIGLKMGLDKSEFFRKGKGVKICWNEKFDQIQEDLSRIEADGLIFLEPAMNEVRRRFKSLSNQLEVV